MTATPTDSIEPASGAVKGSRSNRERPPASDPRLLVELPPELVQLDSEAARLLVDLLADLYRKRTR